MSVTDEELISIIQENRILWDTKHHLYKNSKEKLKIWESIANNLNQQGNVLTNNA